VAVERVGGRQARLQRHELRLRVALEGDEEQPRVELVAAEFARFGVGIAAPQDALAGVVCGVRQADVGVKRDRQLAVGFGCLEIDTVVLVGKP
jgi:hypothetical protein